MSDSVGVLEFASVAQGIAAADAMVKSARVELVTRAAKAEALVPALAGVHRAERGEACGIVETFTVASAVLAADAAVKTARVGLWDLRAAHGMGGKSFVIVTGPVGDVQAAVDAAAEAVGREGPLVGVVVVPAMDQEVWERLG